MPIIKKRARSWGGLYGTTHRGFVVLLFGVPVFRRKRPVAGKAPVAPMTDAEWQAFSL
jgi:hypothetical protein